ncbi:MAG: hypothetical protein NTX48_21480 [Planctomycetales bacterium]|nr:hypothetical protein [Planctomycetales bacterium]
MRFWVPDGKLTSFSGKSRGATSSAIKTRCDQIPASTLTASTLTMRKRMKMRLA